MSYKLKQGDTIATLSNLVYSPPDGYIDGEQAYAVEEILSADSDEVLEDGEASLLYNGKTYRVFISIPEYPDPDAEEDAVDEPAASEILIDYHEDGGLQKLAGELELL